MRGRFLNRSWDHLTTLNFIRRCYRYCAKFYNKFWYQKSKSK